MSNNIIDSKLKGQYMAVIARPDGSTESTGWFDNMILNSGLDLMGQNSSALTYCQLGTGTTVPAATQTALTTYRASGSMAAITASNLGSPTYSGKTVLKYTYAQGAVTGNITELGIGPNASTGPLFSRALISDGAGNPVALTVTSVDQLTIYYSLTLTQSLSESAGTVTISGVDYSYIIRPYTVGSLTNSSIANAGFGQPGSCQAYASDIVSVPYTATSPTGTACGAATMTAAAYVPGTYYSSVTATFAPATGNPTTLYTGKNQPTTATLTQMCKSADGKNIYSCSSNESFINMYSIDLSTYAISALGTIAAGVTTTQLAISQDQLHVYSANTAGSINVYARDAVTGLLTLASTTPVVSGATSPGGLCVTPDGTGVYMSYSNGISSYTRNTSTGALTSIGLITTTLLSNYTILSSSDNLFIYAGTTTGINILARNTTTNVLTLSSTASVPDSTLMCMSADTTKLYTSAYNGTTLYSYNRNTTTGALTAVNNVPAPTITGLSMSPNGSTLYACGISHSTVYHYAVTALTGALAAYISYETRSTVLRILAAPDNLHVYTIGRDPVGTYGVYSLAPTSGIGGFDISPNNGGSRYIAIVTPTIPKTITKSFTLNYRVSWSAQ